MSRRACMKRLVLLFALASFVPACAADSTSTAGEDPAETEDALTLATDTKIKNAVMKTASGLSFVSESDHDFVWVRSAKVQKGPASAAIVHAAFNSVTDGDAMADKPLSSLKSETVPFESFASRFVPVAGEDADNFAYHQRMTKLLGALRDNLKNPIVIRMGRPQGNGLVGAISVYIIGTLPSGKVGGVFTVSVET